MEADLGELRAQLRGQLIGPQDEGYEAARQVYNGMIQRRPWAIAQVADVADILACVKFSRENGIAAAVRCGGHNAAGLGVCDGGLVIDLSRMRGVRVDPAARTARVEGGCRWGDVDHATHAFGLAVPAGIISTTGVAGLTLGGGLGYLSRKHGLTIDNLLEADVILADGSFVKATANENADLYWAIRGGGGNFGIVTSFLFRAHPVKMVTAGPTFWGLDEAEGVLQRYAEFIAEAPEDANGFFAFTKVPPVPIFPKELHERTVCGVVWCATAPPEKAEAMLKPVRGFGKPLFDHVGPMPFPALQSLFDPLLPPGMQWYWKADFVKTIPQEAVKLNVKHGSAIPTLLSTMHLYPINGAAQRVGASETAWAYRDATWAQVICGIDSDPANNDRITRWARDYWEDLHPYSAGAAYVNFMMEEGQDRIQATYGENYPRLAAIKSKYDPENFFRVNQNIRPYAQTAGR